ncbi:hypothetical protein LXA43DRAFT_129858 [Ganoderma leucocontextum]|nr:hypothetical protein LXA43DRAFT_129858 [Ganoderma leucocontextum]
MDHDTLDFFTICLLCCPAICYCSPSPYRPATPLPRTAPYARSSTILGIYPPCPPRAVRVAARCPSSIVVVAAGAVSVAGPHSRPHPHHIRIASHSVCRCSACTLGRVHVICTRSRTSFPSATSTTRRT